jgi:hypothetical protein
VHGAFAESASWNDVIGRLQDQCYTAIAAANPIPSVAGDAQFVASILESIQGPHRPRCSTCVFGDLGGSTNSRAADTWKRRGFLQGRKRAID